MSMHDLDPLLRDVLSEGSEQSYATASLDRMLTLARRKRRVRKVGRFAAALTAIVVLIFGTSLLQNTTGPAAVANAKSQRARKLEEPASKIESPHVRRLSDEELFALFPGRQMAIIGRSGEE